MNIYILLETDYEKNSHLCGIYQSRQVEKDDKVYFYEYGNKLQWYLYYKIPLFILTRSPNFHFRY